MYLVGCIPETLFWRVYWSDGRHHLNSALYTCHPSPYAVASGTGDSGTVSRCQGDVAMMVLPFSIRVLPTTHFFFKLESLAR